MNKNIISSICKATAIIAVIITGLSSCKSDPKKPEKTQMQSVMEVHDAVMPKMGTIGRLVKELGTKKDSLSALESPNKIAIQKIEIGLDSLKNGHKLMMDWMKDFGSQFTAEEILKGKELSAEKKIALDKEAIKVAKMEAAINGSIDFGEALLAQ
ncbi:MAG: hypothetical protein KIH80_000180 [Flavobacteriia bacterium]|nr:hypothetical protein [Flavobacteriia bacterium]